MNAASTLLPTSLVTFANLAGFIEYNKTAIFTMMTSDGTLHSRPLITREVDLSGHALWFYMASNFAKAEEMLDGREVGLSYAAPDRSGYYSVSGRAQVVHDKAKATELWEPGTATRFPTSPDDPRLVLVRVTVEAVEYWDAP